MVNKQMTIIEDIQRDEWWEDVTIPMLERVRRRLRLLVKFIDKQQRHPVFTNFEDEMGNETEIDLPIFSNNDFEKFKEKVRHFLSSNLQHITINKLRMNKPLTEQDLQELEKIFSDNGIGDQEVLEKIIDQSNGLGLFIRSLVGLDREAAKQAFGDFLQEKRFTSNQIEFVNIIIDHLTENGIMDPALLYESPFTDMAPRGPEDIFSSENVDKLITILNEVRQSAIAA